MLRVFTSLKEIPILKNEPLNKYTFTKTGGPADFLAFPKSVTEVKALLEECRQNNLPWMVLGNASNLIVRDGGIRGLVIMLEKLNHIEVKGNQITSQAGAKLIDTTYVALEHHLTGFEFACGIPGSIGGAVFMNAGAYGGEIKDVFVSCEVLYPDGQIKTLSAKEMAFSYRHSAIQAQRCIVLSATFDLQVGNYDEIKAKMDELTHLRASKQPLEYPSCGSVFKRPVGHYTGPLIEQAGLKGMTIGGAQVSEKHAGFIVNINHATATDYVNLIQYIQKVIKEKFDVTLETEVRIIGEEVQ
ncbi:UDP-N-acetylmuramate dehydrogenase [Enterococcus cecorum]|uniref:UDP-N-acetylmuramate dehydrogenase n=1 Tax=Enterococcus cecorum TaxID=44008 RepID=UPI00064381DF|nr:UDP-N-acetylmuramate dehydrogenase [Enterococcus cecorum]KLO70332.1 UDP-N-acetylenolpyruvoylglucosamine reductase [Enterococcus cecorum]